MIWLIVFMAGASCLIVFPTTILSGFPRLFYHFRGFGTGSVIYSIINQTTYAGDGEYYFLYYLRRINEFIFKGAIMKFERCFTKPLLSPYQDITWEKRKSELYNSKGELLFKQDVVIVPSFWSQIATDILAQKYFRK
jgi:hypothetical protein